MGEVEVTVRMPHRMLKDAVRLLRSWGYTAESERAKADLIADGDLAAAHLLRAAMLEHTLPWEPTEEQVAAYCEAHDWCPRPSPARSRADLIAAHAVLCEGDR